MDPQAFAQDRTQRADARSDPRLDWWRAARFGLFIHWGLYAIPAGQWQGQAVPGIGEWIMHRARIPVAEYEPLAAQFYPVKFDAREWVSLAKTQGGVLRHHGQTPRRLLHAQNRAGALQHRGCDALWPRPGSRRAGRRGARQGLRFGFYYSQTQDWHHPDGDGNDWDYDESKDFAGYIEDYVKPQVRELLTNYGPIALIWFDTPKGITAGRAGDYWKPCMAPNPTQLVCGRLEHPLGDYASARQRHPWCAGGRRLGGLPRPSTIRGATRPTIITGSPPRPCCTSWWTSPARAATYLLNVGPDCGRDHSAAQRGRLQEMGAWLAVSGESVYGARAGPGARLDLEAVLALAARLMCMSSTGRPADTCNCPLMNTASSVYLLADPARTPLKIQSYRNELAIHGALARRMRSIRWWWSKADPNGK